MLYHLFVLFLSDIDNDGVIEPDTDEPQEMGEFENTEVKCWAFLYHLWLILYDSYIHSFKLCCLMFQPKSLWKEIPGLENN